jgi:hypothetical protein
MKIRRLVICIPLESSIHFLFNPLKKYHNVNVFPISYLILR